MPSPAPRKSPSPPARKSIPLRSPLRNHATSPWKAHPCPPREARRAAIAIAQFAQLAKYGRARSGSSVNGGTVISPRNSRCSEPRSRCSSSSNSRDSAATPLFAASPPTLISISTLSFLPRLRAAASSFSANFTRIHRLHCAEQFRRLARLVRLQMTDHVPLGIQPNRHSALSLPSKFLHSIFPEQPQPRVISFANMRSAAASCSPPLAKSLPDSAPRAALPPRSAARTAAIFSAIDIRTMNHKGHEVSQRK